MPDAPASSPLPYSPAADGNVVCDIRPDGATVRVLVDRRRIIGTSVSIFVCAAVVAGSIYFFRTVGIKSTVLGILLGVAITFAAFVGMAQLLALSRALNTVTFHIDAHRVIGVWRTWTGVSRREFHRQSIDNVVADRLHDKRHAAWTRAVLLRSIQGYVIPLGIGSARETRAIAAALRRALDLPDPPPPVVYSPTRRARHATFGSRIVSVMPPRPWLPYVLAAPVALLAGLAFDRWTTSATSVPWAERPTTAIQWDVIQVVGIAAGCCILVAPFTRLRRHSTLAAQGGRLILIESGLPRAAHQEWPVESVLDLRAVPSPDGRRAQLDLALADGTAVTLLRRLKPADAEWIVGALRGWVVIPPAATAPASSAESPLPPEPAADA